MRLSIVIHFCFLFLSFVLYSVHPIDLLYHYPLCCSFFDIMKKWKMDQREALVWYLVLLLGVLTYLMVPEYLILDGMLYTQWKTLKFWMILESVMSILFILTVPCQYVFPCLLLFHISTNYFFDLHEVPWSKFLYFSCSQMITKSGFHLLAIMVIIS